MIRFTSFLVSLVFCGVWAQNPNSICHDNHEQLTEDQVIHTVVSDIDHDGNGEIQTWELFIFFGDLMGQDYSGMVHILQSLTAEQIVALSTTVGAGAHKLTKQEFTHAWHTRYNDSMAFVQSAFDDIIDTNNNGLVDATEIHNLLLDAQTHYDANGDGALQSSELEAFFESIYKRPGCVADPVGRR